MALFPGFVTISLRVCAVHGAAATHSYVCVYAGSITAAARLLPALSVYIEFTFDHYQ